MYQNIRLRQSFNPPFWPEFLDIVAEGRVVAVHDPSLVIDYTTTIRHRDSARYI